MTTYFGMHMSLTFIHNLCYISYCFEVIKGFKRSKKVKKGHFFLIWKWLKKWSIYFFKGKKQYWYHFFIKKMYGNIIFWFWKMKNSLWNNLSKKKDTPKIMDLKFPQPISITGIWVLSFWLIMEWIEAKLWPCLLFGQIQSFFHHKKKYKCTIWDIFSSRNDIKVWYSETDLLLIKESINTL